MPTIFVTKYALSSGIFSMEAEIKKNGRACGTRGPHGWTYSFGIHDYALTESDAIDKFHGMRIKRIASLNKQLKALEAMTPKFKAPCQ